MPSDYTEFCQKEDFMGLIIKTQTSFQFEEPFDIAELRKNNNWFLNKVIDKLFYHTIFKYCTNYSVMKKIHYI